MVFLHHRLADAEAQSSAAARPFRRVERIKNACQIFSCNAGAIIVEAYPDCAFAFSEADSQAAAIPHFTDCLLSIHDQVQEHLH